MTCIVGIEDKGKVYIGGDSAGVSGSNVTVRADEKVFKTGPFLMGYTSSFRMGQILRFKFKVDIPKGEFDNYEFMCTTFIDACRKTFKDNGFAIVNNIREEGGTFLVGFNSKLYCVEGDFQVGRALDGIHSVGSGSRVAIGALAATPQLPPKKRALNALAISERHCGAVSAPFLVISD